MFTIKHKISNSSSPIVKACSYIFVAKGGHNKYWTYFELEFYKQCGVPLFLLSSPHYFYYFLSICSCVFNISILNAGSTIFIRSINTNFSNISIIRWCWTVFSLHSVSCRWSLSSTHQATNTECELCLSNENRENQQQQPQ